MRKHCTNSFKSRWVHGHMLLSGSQSCLPLKLAAVLLACDGKNQALVCNSIFVDCIHIAPTKCSLVFVERLLLLLLTRCKDFNLNCWRFWAICGDSKVFFVVLFDRITCEDMEISHLLVHQQIKSQQTFIHCIDISMKLLLMTKYLSKHLPAMAHYIILQWQILLSHVKEKAFLTFNRLGWILFIRSTSRRPGNYLRGSGMFSYWYYGNYG